MPRRARQELRPIVLDQQENSFCTESTRPAARIARQGLSRSSRRRRGREALVPKRDHRAHVSSTGMPCPSGQWSWYRSLVQAETLQRARSASAPGPEGIPFLRGRGHLGEHQRLVSTVLDGPPTMRSDTPCRRPRPYRSSSSGVEAGAHRLDHPLIGLVRSPGVAARLPGTEPHDRDRRRPRWTHRAHFHASTLSAPQSRRGGRSPRFRRGWRPPATP